MPVSLNTKIHLHIRKIKDLFYYTKTKIIDIKKLLKFNKYNYSQWMQSSNHLILYLLVLHIPL